MHPIDHAWAVMKANEVTIDGVTYVPQQGGAQQGQPQEEEPEEQFWPSMPDMSGAKQSMSDLYQSYKQPEGGGLMGAAKHLGSKFMGTNTGKKLGIMAGGGRGGPAHENRGLAGLGEARERDKQRKLAAPNPSNDSPLATDDEQSNSIMDLVPDDDPDAW